MDKVLIEVYPKTVYASVVQDFITEGDIHANSLYEMMRETFIREHRKDVLEKAKKVAEAREKRKNCPDSK